MKGISPIIAVVLLIAFVVAVGGILLTWGTTFLKEKGEEVGGVAERVTRCTQVLLYVTPEDVKYDFSGGAPETLTVTASNRGPEDLYDFHFIISTTEGKWEVEPQNQLNKTNPLRKGESYVFFSTINQDVRGKFETLRIKFTCADLIYYVDIPMD